VRVKKDHIKEFKQQFGKLAKYCALHEPQTLAYEVSLCR